MLQELGFSPYQGIRFNMQPDIVAPVMFLASLPPYEKLNLDSLQNLGKARKHLDADMDKLHNDMEKLSKVSHAVPETPQMPQTVPQMPQTVPQIEQQVKQFHAKMSKHDENMGTL